MPSDAPGHPQPQSVDVFEARYLGRALRRHGAVVVGLAVVGALIGAGWSALSPRVYRAEAVLLVNIQAVRIGADGIPLDVELVPPARRTVGTICQSDTVMSILSARLAGEPEPDWPDEEEMEVLTSRGGRQESRTRPVRMEFDQLYFDQLSQEMAALRATGRDPAEAARLANTWAGVCRQMLVQAFGTTQDELDRIDAKREQARQEVLVAQRAVETMSDDVPAETRLARADALDRAQRLLSELNQHYAMLKVRLDDSWKVARIVSEAAPPTVPINASTGLITGLFGLAGGLLGLAIALFRVPSTL